MKKSRIMLDITDPANPFIHKGGRRKNHTYVVFRTQTSASPTYWNTWKPGYLPYQRGAFMVPQA